MRPRAVYPLFFCSGVSGLVYEVIWVRQFSTVFGNTVYSASLVTAIFMLGLGVGGWLAGAHADRLFAKGTSLPLLQYGRFELAIGVLAGLVALGLPRLEGLSAAISSYEPGAHGWMEISTKTTVLRGLVATVLLTPITLLMGATLTLLVRHVVGAEVERAGSRIGMLYAVNTAGAALGCVLTDFVLVPAGGLLAGQAVAVLLNFVAALLAMRLARGQAPAAETIAPSIDGNPDARVMALTAVTLALAGFVGMGLEIAWLRHLISLLGPLRYVFSLLLTVMLLGTWCGSALAGLAIRGFGRPEILLAIAQALLVAIALATLGLHDRGAIEQSVLQTLAWASSKSRTVQALAWYFALLRPVAVCVLVPSLLLGTSFPLANAYAQRVAAVVGRRAGTLYLANTFGAVCGSLLCGLVLLPTIGLQRTALVIGGCSLAAIVALALARPVGEQAGRSKTAFAASAVVAVLALVAWARLPRDFLLHRAVTVPPPSKEIAASEGIGETIAIVEGPTGDRALYTNGHPMSTTRVGGQRYMRLFAHAPLLMMDEPKDALVICFGVGNTLSAVLLHDELERVDLVDVSRHVLEHGHFFAATNRDALTHPKVRVHVNDGRQHLRMQPPASYDLVTLEPPPLAHAGVAGLYARELYLLAKSRLKPGGIMTQWFPVYQLSEEAARTVVRAFVDVFPSSIMLNGASADFILLGVNAERFDIEPRRLASRLERKPAVRDELRTIMIDDVTDIVGAFASSRTTMAGATARDTAVSDDYPIIEYVSFLDAYRRDTLTALFDVRDIDVWCPTCAEEIPDLAGVLEVTRQLYATPAFHTRDASGVTVRVGDRGREAIERRRYLRWLLQPR